MGFARTKKDEGFLADELSPLRALLDTFRHRTREGANGPTHKITTNVVRSRRVLWNRLHEPQVFGAIARRLAADPSAVNAILTLLEGQSGQADAVGRYRADLEEAIRQEEHQALPVRSVREHLAPYLPSPALLSEALSGVLLVPRRYLLGENGVDYLDPGTGARVPVCAAPLLLASRVVDRETEESYREILFRGPDGWRRRLFPRATLSSSAKLLSAMSALDGPVTSTNAAAVVRYLEAFDAENTTRLPRLYRTRRLGWQADESFLLPDTHYAIDASSPLLLDSHPLIPSRAAAWTTAGDWSGWLEAVRIARTYPTLMLVLYASLAAPLLRRIGAAPFGLHLSGPSSMGKSTALFFAASVWGSPRTVLGWDDGRVYGGVAADFLHDLPLLLDDSGQVGAGVVAGLADTLCRKTVLISSGRTRILAAPAQQAGLDAKLIGVHGFPLGPDVSVGAAAAEAITDICQRHYGHLGRHFLDLLTAIPDATLAEDYRKLVNHYGAVAKAAVHRRHAKTLAALSLAATIAHEKGRLLVPACSPLGDLQAILARGSVDAESAWEALRLTSRWAQRNEVCFLGRASKPPDGGWWGKWARGRKPVVLRAVVLEDFLKAKGFAPTAILNQWREQSWITSNEAEQTIETLETIDATRWPCITITRAAFERALRAEE